MLLYTYNAPPTHFPGVPHGSGGEADPIFYVDSRKSSVERLRTSGCTRLWTMTKPSQ